MQWQIKHTLTKKSVKDRQKEIIHTLLSNRGISNKNQADIFLHPVDPLALTAKDVGMDESQLSLAIKRVDEAIKNKQQIVIFGDYDADGITATAVMWEVLNHVGANVMPFIPHREKHGYGLSVKAVDEVIETLNPNLIITVDNGIVAHEAAEYIEKQKIDLIISDHHVKANTSPKALAIVHTTQLAGAGVSWFFCKEYIASAKPDQSACVENTLELAAIGTVADQVSLLNCNRSIALYGIKKLQTTRRVGLQELFAESGLTQSELSTHHINFVIAPRINAMGRLAHGLDSLRLLCTADQDKARKLAKTLGNTNQERQGLTFELLELAKSSVANTAAHIIVVEHEQFHEGVIGLVAGKLTEWYYRPSIVIGKNKEVSKASARSVPGVNIIDLIRKAEHLLINAGGHPMAAGFTIETEKIALFKNEIDTIANASITSQQLTPALDIDCCIELSDITDTLYKLVSAFEPYGVDNRKPLFCLKNVSVLEKSLIGKNNNHLKLIFPFNQAGQVAIDALWFGKAEVIDEIKEKIDLVCTIDENVWRGRSKLQLMIRDIKIV